tara:strand:- start:3271 stop:3747 length:477 start_codon:yes stop_codon:yes gene_type:complete
MDRRDFIKAGIAIAAVAPFTIGEDAQAADVQIFVKNIEQTIDTNSFSSSSHLYINQFVQPRPMCWVWTPYGWTIQAQPVYYGHNLNFRGHLNGYRQLTQRRENIKQINIYDADYIYILEDGSIKIYDRKAKSVESNSVIPNYAIGLGRIDAHYRGRAR